MFQHFILALVSDMATPVILKIREMGALVAIAPR